MATINALFLNAECGKGCVTYNGSKVTFGATVLLTAGGTVKFKPKKHCHKATISVTNQDLTNTLSLTRGAAVTSIGPGLSASFKVCKCKAYVVGVVVP